MRVLVILSTILVISTASTEFYNPVGFAARFLEPKSSYEYQASVQTSDYNNFVTVRSEDPAAPLPNNVFYRAQPINNQVIAAPEPTAILVKGSEPKVEVVSATEPAQEPILIKSEPKLEVKHHQAVLIEPTQVNYVHAYPALQPVIRTVVNAHQPIVKHIQPTYLPVETPAVLTAHELKTATPIIEVQQEVIGQAVVDHGVLTQKTQYHSQDEDGRATYGHSEPLQTHNAYQDEHGSKSGSFSYIDPSGRLLTTNYVADENGYRAKTNALPVHHIEEAKSRRRRSVAYSSPVQLYTSFPYHSTQIGYTSAIKSYPQAYKTAFPVVYHQPLAYSAVPTYYNAPLRSATLTNIVHNPGHAVSYRVD